MKPQVHISLGSRILRKSAHLSERDTGHTDAPTGDSALPAWDSRAMLIGLMAPMCMLVLNMSMLGVALPSLRDHFTLSADLVAWLSTAYTLPFVMFMPLYGRLGDSWGKRRLFLIGIIIFFGGSLVSWLASNLPWLLVGRMLQGIGAAGVNPLSIAMIAELFPMSERGKAFGTWNSTGPAIAMIGPFLGGFLIDHWGWRAIFITGILTACVTLYVVHEQLPTARPLRPVASDFLRRFDWIGLGLLSGGIVSFIFYLSSRPITGMTPLQDWRLLFLAIVCWLAFYTWERRLTEPLLDLTIFARRNFTRASFCALLRMCLMSTDTYLIPLYFTDIFGLSATGLGVVSTLHAGSLLVTTRFAGKLADKGNGRVMILLGFTIQASMMGCFALLPATTPLPFAVLALIGHGLGAGLSLAVLSYTVMRDVPPAQSGAAAGLHSMIRFTGSMVGSALGGVTLQYALDHLPVAINAYHLVFWSVAVVGLLGVVTAARLKDDSVQ